jgi:selenocysteine lyase/cysteine desulfurase
MLLTNQKHLFDIPTDVTYLNCSYLSPQLINIRQAGISGMDKKAFPWTIKMDDWFKPGEDLRSLFAKIINAGKDSVALVPSVSYGTAIAARNISLRANQKIILLDRQYPSNVYAWRELSKESGAEIVTVAKEAGQNWTEAILEKMDEHTGLVAIPNCHWTDGSLIDLEVISRKTKSISAKLVIDASQSVGAYPLDIQKIKPDFLVSVGYKWLMGPYGLGYIYCDQKYWEAGAPIEHGWLNRKGSEDFTRLVDYQDDLQPGARRFDAGEYPDFVKIPMAIAALTQVLEWGVANIQETLSGITGEIEMRARKAGYETPQREHRTGHMIGIKIPDDQISRIGKKLSEHKVFVSFRGSSMRVAPHLYNDLDDVRRLFEFL